MKKKIIIAIAILFAVICTSAVGFAVATGATKKEEKPSDYKIGIAYEKALESDKPMVGLIYVDWCGYCLRFMPKFKVLSMMYKGKYNFVMINAEDPANKDLMEDVALTGFPTVYVMDPKFDNRFLINNAIYHNTPKFQKELDRYLRIRGLLLKADKK